jgi:hypothetical protein
MIMETYEYPAGVTFKASTPEHAAARIFGGRPGKYLATVITVDGNRYVEAMAIDRDGNRATYTWLADIPIINR